MAEFSHIILTRFNVKYEIGGKVTAAPDSDWLLHRFVLFDKFTYPSVHAQTNLDFKWVVFFDIDTPDIFRNKIDTYVRWENFNPYYIDVFENLNLDQFILENISSDSRYLITTRLDNDDALSVDFIENVQLHFYGQDNEFVNFLNGYKLSRNKLYITKHPSNIFISLIESIEGFKTVYCEMHEKLSLMGKIKQVETKPLWLQVIHGRNVSNRVHNRDMRVPIKLLDEDFRLNYAYDSDSEKLFTLHLENRVKKIKAIARKLLGSMRPTLKRLLSKSHLAYILPIRNAADEAGY